MTSLVAAALTLVVSAASAEHDTSAAPEIAVAPQYDTTHVYVSPDDVAPFVQSFIATFGGSSTHQVIATVTPTYSSTSSQLVRTPVGTVSLFGFRTPIPYPFGSERNGYLVTDMDAAVDAARKAGADVLVHDFADPIGRDAIVQWPGGVNLQLYWHTAPPSYPPLRRVPEDRIYLSPDRVTAFVTSFTAFSHGRVVEDEPKAAGLEIGQPDQTYRRIRIESAFGKMTLVVTDGHLRWPWGRETTGYEVDDVTATLAKARAAGVRVLVDPLVSGGRSSTIVQFPGGYIAEIHAQVH